MGHETPTPGAIVWLATTDEGNRDSRADAGSDAMRTALVHRDATADAPISPGAWNMVGYQWSEFWRGRAESISGIGHLLWDYSVPRQIIDPLGVGQSELNTINALGHRFTHSTGLAKGVVDYGTPKDVPTAVIVRDGSPLIFRAHSAQALIRAGMPRSSRNVVDRISEAAHEARLTGHLSRNGLTGHGTDLP